MLEGENVLSEFNPATQDEVCKIIMNSSSTSKSCSLDAIYIKAFNMLYL